MTRNRLGFDTRLQWRFWGAHASPAKRGWMGTLLMTSAALFIAGSWFAAQAFEQHREALEQEASLQKVLERLSDPAAQQPTQQHEPLKANERKGLNRVIQHLNTPWPVVFETIEKLTPTDVAILRMEPDEKGVLTIEAEATSVDKVLAFAGQLAHQGAFGELLYQHHDTNEQDPNKPARLSFQLRLKGVER
ncbi:hypothetical protein [Hydrogenophaga luteola]|uniref:PilN domain-containing protein n=1 Tax=Hydrogenophaga luteola TaxID=1591122 RepID=A0ABV7W4J4_9BURK